MLATLLELLSLASTLAIEGPKIIAEVEKIWDTWTAKEPPTEAERAEFLAALEASHKAVQAM